MWRELFLSFTLPGAGDPEAESERGEGEAAGAAGALQEVFDTTQHPLGQGARQRAYAQVTSPRLSASEGTVTRRRWAGTRPLSALEALERSRSSSCHHSGHAQLRHPTRSRFIWSPATSANCGLCWPDVVSAVTLALILPVRFNSRVTLPTPVTGPSSEDRPPLISHQLLYKTYGSTLKKYIIRHKSVASLDSSGKRLKGQFTPKSCSFYLSI